MKRTDEKTYSSRKRMGPCASPHVVSGHMSLFYRLLTGMSIRKILKAEILKEDPVSFH